MALGRWRLIPEMNAVDMSELVSVMSSGSPPWAARSVAKRARACHSNCVSRRCTKIGLSDWQPEGAPRDRGHIVGSVVVECWP